VEPDLTLILDMDPATALERGLARSSGEDRFEEFGLEFQQKLRAGFLALAEEAADRCVVIDASDAPGAVAARIRGGRARAPLTPRRPAIAPCYIAGMSDDALPEADRLDGAPHPRETLRLFGQDVAEAAFLARSTRAACPMPGF
jgi:hypothetical protein